MYSRRQATSVGGPPWNTSLEDTIEPPVPFIGENIGIRPATPSERNTTHELTRPFVVSFTETEPIDRRCGGLDKCRRLNKLEEGLDGQMIGEIEIGANGR